MKVLMLGRIDLLERRGGDTVQIENTAAELRNLGVEVDISTDLKCDMSSYNLVHIFQLDWIPEIYFFAKRAKQFNKKMKERNQQEHIDYSYFLLIDGNYFNPIQYMNQNTKKWEQMNHMCVEGGDNAYSAIAAASILAKVERDRYIEELCLQNPTLKEHYAIDSNKGYGAKKHMDGIKEHGITIWHRRSFGICKNYV